MPRKKHAHWSKEYSALRSTSNVVGEKGDCAVQALSLLTGVPYEQMNQALIEGGRKPRRGTPWIAMKFALAKFGFKMEPVENFSAQMIATYPGVHKNLGNVTTHHPRRFKKQWKDVEPLLLDMTAHVAAFKDGTIHDWSINNSKRVHGAYRIISDGTYQPPQPCASERLLEATERLLEVATSDEDIDDGLLIDGKDPLAVLLDEHAKTMSDRKAYRV